jgi:hypothetical protein
VKAFLLIKHFEFNSYVKIMLNFDIESTIYLAISPIYNLHLGLNNKIVEQNEVFSPHDAIFNTYI